MGFWIYIDRQYSRNLAVGPYFSRTVADHAMQNALLIDAFCEEDCLDAYISEETPKLSERNIVKVDLDDPDHTGLGKKEDTTPGSPLGIINVEYVEGSVL